MNRGSSSDNASAKLYVTLGTEGSSACFGVTVSTSSAPSWSRSTFLISASICSLIASWFFVFLAMCSRRIAIRMPASGLAPPLTFSLAIRKLAYGCSGISALGNAVKGSRGS